MSPRAFRTMLVGPMGTKDRLELESRVLAAALKQSVELGDNAGVSLAHRQIFLLIRSAHGAGQSQEAKAKSEGGKTPSSDSASASDESVSRPEAVKKRNLPNIVWTEAEEDDQDEGSESYFDSTDETIEVPISAEDAMQVIINGSASEPKGDSSEDEGANQSFAPTENSVSLTRTRKSQPKAHLDENVFDAYGILGVVQVASFDKIHVGFLVVIRRLLIKIKKTKKRKRKELLNELQELWIAHDVLTDPVTRTDYDFRILGLRGAPDVIIDTPDSEGQVVIGSSIPLRIGELLQCAGLLEPTELEIAADMHRAMPEMLFGAFLVKQGFITEPDLDQVLMGQRLLKMGYFSVATFQSCMQHWIDSDTPIYESAVTEGLITLSEMERIIAQGLRDTDTEIPAIQGGQVGFRSGGGRGKVQSIGTGPMLNEEEARKRMVSADHAVPEWKDQLDWSAPPEEEPKPIKMKVRRESKQTIETSAYHIEGVTTSKEERGAPGPERKSLRSLMKGMHMDDKEGNEEEDDDDQIVQLENNNASVLTAMLQGDPSQLNSSQGQDVEVEQLSSEMSTDAPASTVGGESSAASYERQSFPVAEDAPGSEAELSATWEERARSGQQEALVSNIESGEESDSPDNQSVSFEVEQTYDSSYEENYDEEDEPVLDFEDSLELPVAEIQPREIETYSDLDSLSSAVAKPIEIKTSAQRAAINNDTRYDGDTSEIELEKTILEGLKSPDRLGSDADEEDTTEEIKQIALTLKRDEEERGSASGDSDDPQEAARQALKKSIEWQVMYKIKGSLADMLLSDSEDADLPPLSPRLEDIDVMPKNLSSSSGKSLDGLSDSMKEDSSENGADDS